MAVDAGQASRADEWGPVRRGFRVSLPDGERGSVTEIRRGECRVELVVTTGLFVRRRVTVDAREIEAILPAARRIVIRGSAGAVSSPAADPEVEAAGGILRMPVRHGSRIGSPSREVA